MRNSVFVELSDKGSNSEIYLFNLGGMYVVRGGIKSSESNVLG